MSASDTSERQPLPPYVLPIVLALIPLIYLIWTCQRTYVDVPVGDQWELVERFDKLDAGTLRLHDVWRQHNEHRPLFPILYMLYLGRATGWITGAEIASSIAMAVATFALATGSLLVKWRERPAWVLWLLPPASLLFFSMVQWENWIQGWQLGVFMCVFFSVLGFWLLSRPDRRGLRLAGALVAGFIATYSFGSGISYWVGGLAPMRLNPAQRSVWRLVVWAGVAGLTMASYLYDYRGNPDAMRANFATLSGFARFLAYIPQYLGGPVAGVNGVLAFVPGVAVLGAYAVLVATLWPWRATTAFLFPATMGLNTLGVATITALGRAVENNAAASRYTTMAIPMWIAVLLLFSLAVTKRAEIARWVVARRVVVLAGAGLFCLTVMVSGTRPLVWAEMHYNLRKDALLPLIRGDELPTLGRLYVNSGEEVMRRREVLKRLRLSVFRPGRYKL